MFNQVFIFQPADRKTVILNDDVKTTLPKNISQNDFHFFSEKYISSPFYLVNDKNATIIKAGIVGKSFKIHEYSIPLYPGKRNQFIKQYIYNVIIKSGVKFKSAVTVIHNPWCPGYYHWVTEALCRLFILDKYYQEDIKIVLPDYFKLVVSEKKQGHKSQI